MKPVTLSECPARFNARMRLLCAAHRRLLRPPYRQKVSRQWDSTRTHWDDNSQSRRESSKPTLNNSTKTASLPPPANGIPSGESSMRTAGHSGIDFLRPKPSSNEKRNVPGGKKLPLPNSSAGGLPPPHEHKTDIRNSSGHLKTKLNLFSAARLPARPQETDPPSEELAHRERRLPWQTGEVTEWPIVQHWKCCVWETGPGVQIPPSPPSPQAVIVTRWRPLVCAEHLGERFASVLILC